MKNRIRNALATSLLAALTLVAPAGADGFGYAMTYQGELKSSGSPMNGTADLVFRLFNAATGGVQLGPTLVLDDVVVTDGIFKVELDFTNGGTIPGVYDGTGRWLEIAVNGTPLTPRQELNPSPHALVAWQLQLPYAAQTTANPAFTLIQTADGPQTRAMHIASTAADTGSVAILGEMLTQTDENGVGVMGISRAGNGFGVGGANLSPTGNCSGVYGNAESVNGTGVVGWASHPSGATRGVSGKVFSPNGHAGYFEGRGYFSGQVGIGVESPSATLEVQGYDPATGHSLNVDNHFYVWGSSNFVSVNRTVPVTGSEYFGVGTPASAADEYGGMYVSTEGAASRPFYGYSCNGIGRAWTYFAGAADEWRLNVGGDRLNVVRTTGNVGVKRSPTSNDLEVEGTASKTTAGSWLANSDARIKTDIATVEGALETLDRVRLVRFRYADEYRRAHPEIEDRTYLNVIAQEFGEVFPDHVKGSGEHLPGGEEILQVDTYPLTIYSAAAVQELHAIVREQGERLAAKDAEIAEIRDRMARLESIVATISRQGDGPVHAASLERGR